MLTYHRKNLDIITFIFSFILFLCLDMAIHLFLTNLSELQNQKSNFLQKEGDIYCQIIPIQKNAQTSKEIQPNLLESQKTNQIRLLFEPFQQNRLEENKVVVSKELTEEQTFIQNQETKMQQAKESQTPIVENGNKLTTQREAVNSNKNNNWRIQIPKLNLDVHILEGTTSNILLTAVGHFEETTKWNGNVGLAAHNRGYNCNFFQDIKNLKLGDEIIYLTNEGKRIYKVTENKVIEETDWSYLQPTKENKITLITCEENRKAYRRCVQAIEVPR